MLSANTKSCLKEKRTFQIAFRFRYKMVDFNANKNLQIRNKNTRGDYNTNMLTNKELPAVDREKRQPSTK